MTHNPQESEKDLRRKLYRRQGRLLGLLPQHEIACLPGQLLRVNPNLFNTQPKRKTP